MPVTTCRAQLMQRAVKSDGFTKKKRAAFLDALAATCNVTTSAQAAGVHKSTAQRLRRRDPAFASLWEDAIRIGTERLREAVLAYSLGQLDLDENPDGERSEEPAKPFDVQQACRSLETIARIEARAGDARRGGGRPGYATDAEVTRLLIERLDALARRREQA